MTDTQAVVLLGLSMPVVILGLVGMVRGYHMHVKVWKGDHHDDGDHDGR